MVKLSEEMIMARTRVSDMGHVKKLNCWGADLSDVTVLKKLRNVEVLSLSVNNITTLADIQDCKNLQELYIRKNKIQDLNEICWLRDLPKLKFLWLEENPGAQKYSDLYRATVIRNLPQLQKLDNVPIQPDEIADAHRRGVDLVHPLDAIEESRYTRAMSAAPQAQEYRNYVTQQYEQQFEQVPPQMEPPNSIIESRRSYSSLQTINSSYPNDIENPSSIMDIRQNYERYEDSPPRNSFADRSDQQVGYGSRRNSSQQLSRYSDDDGVPEYHVGRRFSQQEQSNGRRSSPRMSVPAAIDENSSNLRRMSVQDSPKFEDVRNANSEDQVDRSIANGRRTSTQEMRNFVSQQYEQTYEQVQQQVEAAQNLIEARRVSEYLEKFQKRPRNRNSNILSSVLCLIRELDTQSLEVAEMAIRCRREELED